MLCQEYKSGLLTGTGPPSAQYLLPLSTWAPLVYVRRNSRGSNSSCSNCSSSSHSSSSSSACSSSSIPFQFVRFLPTTTKLFAVFADLQEKLDRTESPHYPYPLGRGVPELFFRFSTRSEWRPTIAWSTYLLRYSDNEDLRRSRPCFFLHQYHGNRRLHSSSCMQCSFSPVGNHSGLHL